MWMLLCPRPLRSARRSRSRRACKAAGGQQRFYVQSLIPPRVCCRAGLPDQQRVHPRGYAVNSFCAMSSIYARRRSEGVAERSRAFLGPPPLRFDSRLPRRSLRKVLFGLLLRFFDALFGLGLAFFD